MNLIIREDFLLGEWEEIGQELVVDKAAEIAAGNTATKIHAKTQTFFCSAYQQSFSQERQYLNQTSGCIWLKFTAITLATPAVHPIALIISGIAQLMLGKTATDRAKGLLVLIFSPLLLAAVILIVLYGLSSPLIAGVQTLIQESNCETNCSTRTINHLRNARKLYATFERAIYGKSVVAPCFQPMKISLKSGRLIPLVGNAIFGLRAHLFGGKANSKTSW